MTGERLTDKKRYETHCGNCHGKNGEGLRNLYPPLAGSDYLEKNRSKIPCIIRNGLNEPIKVNGKMFDQPMPEMSFLNSRQITGIINFINISWGNDQKEWKQGEVDFVLRKCAVKPEKEP